MPGNSQYLEWEFEKLKKKAENFVSGEVNPVTGGISLSAGGKSLLSNPSGIAKTSPLYTRRVKRFSSLGGSSVNFTFGATIVVPFPWLAVRPVFYNVLSTSVVGATASLAVSANINGGWNAPTGSLTAITQSASASLTIPAAVSGGGVASATAVYSRTNCDLMTLPSVARDDGGYGYLLHMRFFVPTGQTNDIRSSGYDLSSSTLADEFMGGYFSGADKTLDLTGSWTRYDVMPPIALEFVTEAGYRTISLSGDSTSTGYGYNSTATAQQQNSALALALREMHSSGLPVELFSNAYGSMTSQNFLANGLNAISDTKPSLAVLQVGSVNDTDSLWSATWANRCMADAVTWINTCTSLGITPVLRCMNPKNGLTGPQAAVRASLIARVIAMGAAANVSVFNPNTVLEGAGGAYVAAYTTDGIHCNQAGYLAEKALWTSFLSGINF